MSITRDEFLKLLTDNAEAIARQSFDRDIEFWKSILAKHEASIANGESIRDIEWYRKRVKREFSVGDLGSDYDVNPADPDEVDNPNFWSYLSETLPADVPGVGKFDIAEQHGGEGQGDDYYLVIRFTDTEGNESYLKRHGWYASYDGGYYEGPTVLVKAVQKTITIYEDAK